MMCYIITNTFVQTTKDLHKQKYIYQTLFQVDYCNVIFVLKARISNVIKMIPCSATIWHADV